MAERCFLSMDAENDRSTDPSLIDTAPHPTDEDRLVILFACLSLSMIALIVPHVERRPVALSSDAIRSVVDADTAPWWELTVLPGIGPVLAGEIVRYRESVLTGGTVRSKQPENSASRAFSRPADLAKVRGIGAKTVQRISSDLEFRGD